MWTIVFEVLKRPTILAIIVLTIAVGGLYVNNKMQDSKIARLEADIVAVQGNFNTCKTNEETLTEAIKEQNALADGWIASNDALRVQVEDAQRQVIYWQQQYDDKICFNNEDETPVVPSQGKVVKDEKSVDAVNRLNDIFGD